MATSKRVRRELEQMEELARNWEEKAELAVSKGRDDLAREALVERRKYMQRKDSLELELVEHDSLIQQYQEDILQLEEKLESARDKQRVLVQRHIHARRKKRAQEEIRRVDSSDVVLKFEELENRIERMESEADLINFGKKSTLEEDIEKLAVDDEIEKQLLALKEK